MKALDLFSGIGGFSVGLERAGFKTVAFCEIDKYCRLVLNKHWKDTKIYHDVREITRQQYEQDGLELPGIITGGFPCQPFSVAGRQKGSGDNRYLWPEMFRVIKEFKPRWIVAENVRGIINIQDGVVFENVCTDLESQGYETQTFIIPAAGVGAPHRRDRVWIVGYAKHNGSSPATQSRSTSTTSNNNTQGKDKTRESQEQVDPTTVKLWRTPDALSGGSNLPGIKRALDQGHLKRPSGQSIQIRLHDQVREKRLWPTPVSRDWKGSSGRSYKGLERDLPTAVKEVEKLWPTPTANEDACGTPKGKMQKMLGNHPKVRGTGGGTLNPTWVEWLMGYKAGYTDLKDWETLSSRKSRKKSEKQS